MTSTIGGTLSFQALFQWAVALFRSPREFFRGLQKKGGYLGPVLYIAFWALASGLISGLISLFRPASEAARAMQAASLVFGPVIVVLFSFVSAGVLFVIWHLMGSKEDYE